MAGDDHLKPNDFPVHAEENKIVKNDGKDIAEAANPKIAEDLAETRSVTRRNRED